MASGIRATPSCRLSAPDCRGLATHFSDFVYQNVKRALPMRMTEICPSSRVAIELDALRRFMEASAERIEHVAAFMCRGEQAIAPREAFERAGQLDHKLAICERRLDR
ncbi:MAG TPA: hypothetical protein VFR73_13220, partial [Hyphomicrobiaceae bacterium]|nr:hypothetical protein [Hyphomicrobiaceae bacterium]